MVTDHTGNGNGQWYLNDDWGMGSDREWKANQSVEGVSGAQGHRFISCAIHI